MKYLYQDKKVSGHVFVCDMSINFDSFYDFAIGFWKYSNSVIYICLILLLHNHIFWLEFLQYSIVYYMFIFIFTSLDRINVYCSKEKQRSTKHTHKTKDRTPLKTGGELNCSRTVSSSCSTSDTLKWQCHWRVVECYLTCFYYKISWTGFQETNSRSNSNAIGYVTSNFKVSKNKTYM